MNSYTIRAKIKKTIEAKSTEQVEEQFIATLDQLTIDDIDIEEIEDNGEVDPND